MSTAYQKGLEAVSAAAGMEKTALNEKLLGRLLKLDFGDHDWNTRGILQAARTGDAVPLPPGVDVDQKQIRKLVSVAASKFAPDMPAESAQRDFSTRWSNSAAADRGKRGRRFAEEQSISNAEAHRAHGALIRDIERRKVSLRPEETGVFQPDVAFARLLAAAQVPADAPSAVLHRAALNKSRLSGIVATHSHYAQHPYSAARRQRAADTLASGRHSADSFHEPAAYRDSIDGSAGGVGVGDDPTRVLWRGDVATTQHIDPDAPRWVSALHRISRGYPEGAQSSKNLQGHLLSQYVPTITAYDARRIPAEHRGPLTPHVAQDTRAWTQEQARNAKQRAGSASWGASPFYEAVVTQHALGPAETHRYKILPDERLMRVFGDAATDPLKG